MMECLEDGVATFTFERSPDFWFRVEAYDPSKTYFYKRDEQMTHFLKNMTVQITFIDNIIIEVHIFDYCGLLPTRCDVMLISRDIHFVTHTK